MTRAGHERLPVAVEDAAAAAGVELRGGDGQPFHCGERMEVRGGMAGIDYAKCRPCGVTLFRVDSPHINGGHWMSEEFYDRQGDRLWSHSAGPGEP